jgi:hypothetical protein
MTLSAFLAEPFGSWRGVTSVVSFSFATVGGTLPNRIRRPSLFNGRGYLLQPMLGDILRAEAEANHYNVLFDRASPT